MRFFFSFLPGRSTIALHASFQGWRTDASRGARWCTVNLSSPDTWHAPPPSATGTWRKWAAGPTGGCVRWGRCCRSRRCCSPAGPCCRQSPCSRHPTPFERPPQTPSRERRRPWTARRVRTQWSTCWPRWAGTPGQTSSSLLHLLTGGGRNGKSSSGGSKVKCSSWTIKEICKNIDNAKISQFSLLLDCV